MRPANDGVDWALFTTAARNCPAVSEGLIEAHSAIAPDTCGVAMEVPLSDA